MTEDDALIVEGAPLADIAQRAIARVVDCGVWVLAWLTLLKFWFGDERTVAWGLASAAFIVLYEAVPVALTGATFGKRLMSIQIVMARDGSRPPWINAILRVLPAVLAAAVPYQMFLLVLLYSTGGYARNRRGAVDRIAGTAVIKI